MRSITLVVGLALCVAVFGLTACGDDGGGGSGDADSDSDGDGDSDSDSDADSDADGDPVCTGDQQLMYGDCSTMADCCSYPAYGDKECLTVIVGSIPYGVCTVGGCVNADSDCAPRPAGVSGSPMCMDFGSSDGGNCILNCDSSSDCPDDNNCFTYCMPY
jgi:hypothetical protein